MIGRKKINWHRAAATAAAVATVVATAITVATFFRDNKPPQPSKLIGRWNGSPRSSTFAGGVPVQMYATYDFNPSNEFVFSTRMVMKDISSTPSREVICSGLARGRWSVADSAVTLNFTEDLKVALEGAVEGNTRLSGPMAAARGYVCPDTPLIPGGLAEQHQIIDISETTLRLKGVSPKGVAVIDSYERSPR